MAYFVSQRVIVGKGCLGRAGEMNVYQDKSSKLDSCLPISKSISQHHQLYIHVEWYLLVTLANHEPISEERVVATTSVVSIAHHTSAVEKENLDAASPPFILEIVVLV